MRVISIVNQKGGCGKTTTAVNLAGALAADGASVLLLDMDPQAHATLAFGIDPDEQMQNLYEVLIEPAEEGALERVLINASERIDLAPSSIVLSALEQKLAGERHDARTERLTTALDGMKTKYDYVLIDCPPAVGLLTFNALRASQEVIIPLETSFFAIDGVQKLLETIALLTDRIGHDLSVRVLPTLYDGRTRYARETLGDIRELFKDLCFDTVIRLNVKLREAARRGQPDQPTSRTRPTARSTTRPSPSKVHASPPAPEIDVAGRAARRDVTPREVVIHFRDADGRRRPDRRGLQRLDPGQGCPFDDRSRWCAPGLEEDADARAGRIPVPLRRRRRVVHGPRQPGIHPRPDGPAQLGATRSLSEHGPTHPPNENSSTLDERHRLPRRGGARGVVPDDESGRYGDGGGGDAQRSVGRDPLFHSGGGTRAGALDACPSGASSRRACPGVARPGRASTGESWSASRRARQRRAERRPGCQRPGRERRRAERAAAHQPRAHTGAGRPWRTSVRTSTGRRPAHRGRAHR